MEFTAEDTELNSVGDARRGFRCWAHAGLWAGVR